MAIKLAINATSLLSPLTGIGQYTYHLCNKMLEHPDVDPTFFCGLRWSKALRSAPVQGIEWKKEKIKRVVPFAYKILRFIQSSAFKRAPVGIDIYHEPNYLPHSFDYPLVLTVHDVSFIRYPEAHPADRIRALQWFTKAVEKADMIITDSHFSARELVDCFAVNPAKVVPIHLGVTSQYQPRSEQQAAERLQAYGLMYQAYILVVGTLEPRKNLRLVLDAYHQMPANIRAQYPLVVIGMRGWGTDQIDKDMASLIDSGHLRLLGYVPSEDMPFLYAAAKLFVYPSIYEGFGLPPLEAMASGVPVISSNRASLPEVVGDAGVQIDAENVDMLRDVMRDVLENKGKADAMIQQGLLQAKQFSWDKCASETIEVYKRVLG